MRLVSLVPSLTHMAVELGGRDALVGCTSFCVKPAGLHRVARVVGGTKDPDLAAVAALAPTHILVDVEENRAEDIRACQALAPTLVVFPKSPADVPALLREAGAWLGAAAAGERHAAAVAAALAALTAAAGHRQAGGRPPRRFLYYIWREPYMVAGRDTYISAMLAAAGLVNAAPPGARYPVLPVAAAAALAPELVLLSSEPYPFRARDAERLLGEWPAGQPAPAAQWIDGQLLSWYGTMTEEALTALRAWVEARPTRLVRPFAPASAGLS